MSDHVDAKIAMTNGPAGALPDLAGGRLARLRTAFRAMPLYLRSSYVFLITSLLSNIVVSIIVDNTRIKIDYQWYINILIGALLSILFWVWDRAQESLLLLSKRYANQERLTKEAYERGVESVIAALLGSSTAKLYAELASPVSDPMVSNYVKNLAQEKRLEAYAVSAVEEVLRRLKMNNQWYPILTHFMSGEVTGLRNGCFSLSLEAYLDIYLDLMQLYIDRLKDTGKHLHIWSFTNAIPSDWLAGDPSASGNIMKRFADKKMKLIDKMRQNGHVMRMISLAQENPTPALPGIPSVTEILQAWASIGEESRSKYLNKLHTANQEAFVARLGLDDLAFFDGMAEFIFFGLSDGDTIEWDFCIAGGFSSQNQVLRAHYLFLAENNRLILDIPNKRGLKSPHEISAATRLQVSFRDWPTFAFTDKAYGAITLESYEHLLSFAHKWRLTAEIWHTDEERAGLTALLEELLHDKFDVLDAAAGTGYHCEILQKLGKQVSALEVSEQELEYLKKSSVGNQVTAFLGDWRTLPENLNGRQFEAIVCLGSSIPYHSTWRDSRTESASSPSGEFSEVDQETVLYNVIANLWNATKPGGVLVIGLSRHNEQNRNGVSVEFNRKLNGVSYDMQWQFDFDWKEKKRLWKSSIHGDNGEEYAFEVVGHLFDHNYLKGICQKHFSEVELRDIGTEHYDKYLVCKV